MHDRGQQPDIITYNSILDALCKKHHAGKAIALLTKLKDQGIRPNMNTYTILVKGLCRSGKLEDARKVFEDLGYNLDVYAYTVMIQGFCDKGLFDEVLALLSKMEENGCIPDAKTYEIIILSLFEKDENDMAEKLLREMIMRGLL
ncbi:putative pentatricopeptide [Medicago truncatula]|nr:putative pentatricopeptide [Medicago truncatula]